MKSSEFMDKQIMELSRSKTEDSFIFFNPDDDSEDEFDDGRSYGFRRPLRTCSSVGHIDSVNITHEKTGMLLISEIDQRIKEHFDNLLHSVGCLSARLSQLESKTRQLENAVNDLKVSAEYNNGRTDGKLRQLENILREVQDGIHFIRDKQEIAETQLQLAKLQAVNSDTQSEEHKTAVQADSALRSSLSASKHSSQPLPISGAPSLALPALHPDASSTPPHQYPSPAGASVAVQVPSQILQNPIPTGPHPQSYYSPLGKILETNHQQYNRLPTQQVQPPPPEPPQLYQPASNLPQPMQAPQQPQLHPPLSAVNPHNQPPWTHPPEETSLMPSHNYQPTIFQSSLPPGGTPIQQLRMDSSEHRHGQPSRGPQPEFPPGYSHTLRSSNFSNVHPYIESSSHYSSSATKPSQPSSSLLAPGGGSNYTQLPKAQILPHALPTASSVETGSSSGGTGNKVPLDDVVDKVTAMGFRRDLVRATVRRLTENGQSVDLNVVLDKLMNGDRDVQPQKSRLGR